MCITQLLTCIQVALRPETSSCGTCRVPLSLPFMQSTLCTVPPATSPWSEYRHECVSWLPAEDALQHCAQMRWSGVTWR